MCVNPKKREVKMSRLKVALLALLSVCFTYNESRVGMDQPIHENEHIKNIGGVEAFVTLKLVESDLWNNLVSTPEQPVSVYLTRLIADIKKVDLNEMDLSYEYLKRFSDDTEQARALYDQFVGSSVFRDFMTYRANLESEYKSSIIKQNEKHHMWFVSKLLHSKQFKLMISSQSFNDFLNKLHHIILDNKEFTNTYFELLNELISDMNAFTKAIYEHDNLLNDLAVYNKTPAEIFSVLESKEGILDPSDAIYSIHFGYQNNPEHLSISSVGGLIQTWYTLELSRFVERAAKKYPMSSSVQSCKKLIDELDWEGLRHNSRIGMILK